MHQRAFLKDLRHAGSHRRHGLPPPARARRRLPRPPVRLRTGGRRLGPNQLLRPKGKHHRRLLVINGVDAQTNSHTVGIVHNWSGRNSEGYPATPALFAAHHAPALPVSYVNFGGYSETGGLTRYTRLDNPDLLRSIAYPRGEGRVGRRGRPGGQRLLLGGGLGRDAPPPDGDRRAPRVPRGPAPRRGEAPRALPRRVRVERGA